MEDHAEPAPPQDRPQPKRRTRRYLLPLALFIATYASTVWAGMVFVGGDLRRGVIYGTAIMAILLFHEMGHFLQALRHHVPASLPYFIPVPFFPFGTMGAIISMHGHKADRRALFDIGVSGPLAGLVLAIPAVVVGLNLSTIEPLHPGQIQFGDPLLIQWIELLIFGPLPPNWVIIAHPLAFAGWVGLFVTGLNLLPVGQLDGGHVAYALFGKWAHKIAIALMVLFAAFMLLFQYWGWTVWLVLMLLIGPKHPPTANDRVPLGWKRRALGWAALLFVLVGFTPTPIVLGH